MHQTLSHYPAPNFGKTAGVLKIPIEAAGYENAKGFSEIGRRESMKGQANGIGMKSETSQER